MNEDQPDAQGGASAPPEKDSSRQIGKWMIILVWIALLAMLTLFAQRWYERSENLNRDINTEIQNGKRLVKLLGNRNGHYIASGKINETEVVFLLDTGASSISIPAAVASKLDLKYGQKHSVSTANGTVTVTSVDLDRVSIGDLSLLDVAGHVNPHMEGNAVLLGMSFLRHFDLSQRGETLTLSEP